jgi:outer membrane protein
MKNLILTIVVFVIPLLLSAQTTLKIGHINSQDLMQAMPESDSAQVKLEKMTKDLENQFQAMQKEYDNKYKEFVSKKDTYTELIRQTKSTELQEIGVRIQQFQQSAEQDIQLQRMNIYKPILEKANKAIAEVAKENGFTYILDLVQGGVIFYSETSTDILPLTKQKLGLPNKPGPSKK